MTHVPDAAHLEPSPTGARSGWSAVLAVLVPLGCLACLVACLVIEAGAFGAVADSAVTTDPGTYTAITGVVLGLCGAVVLRHDSRQGLGWTLAWFGLFWAVDGTLESYMRL